MATIHNRPAAPAPIILDIGGASRPQIEAAIERLLAMLDAMDPDPDLEPTLGFVMPGYQDELETEDEHGGDIQDEPHDREDEDTGIGDRSALDEIHGYARGWGGFHLDGAFEGRPALVALRNRAHALKDRVTRQNGRTPRDPDRIYVVRPGRLLHMGGR